MALFKSFNSKGFLLLYLVVFGSVLVIWLFQTEQAAVDRRDIPASLRPQLVSPPQPVPQFLLQSADQQKLTEQGLRGKWSFIYFSHSRCMPDCEPVLTVMHNLKQMLANREQQVLLINFRSDKNGAMTDLLNELDLDLTVFSGKPEMLAMLSDSVEFFYLADEDSPHTTIEQQHSIFVSDPQGRLYARFEPPFSSLSIQQRFFEIRDFYARSE